MPGLMPMLMVFIIFILGASIGSFLNVVVYRLPAKLSLLHPPSRCPHCAHPLSPFDNVPVLGWLWLRGRCRYCGGAIAIRYPLVEGVTGLLFVLAFFLFESPLTIVGGWILISWLLALALIDLDTMTLPNPLTTSGLVLGLIVQVALGWTSGGVAEAAAHGFGSVLGAVIGIWLFDLVTIVGSVVYGQTVMGGGDTKLAAMMGAWLGWKGLLLASFLACVIGAIVGGGGMMLGLLRRRQPMPFGPFLAIGAILAAFWGEQMIATYLNIYFPNP